MRNMRIDIRESNGRWFNEIIIWPSDAEYFLRTGVFMGDLAYEYEATGGYARNEAGRARIIGEPKELLELARKVLRYRQPQYLAVEEGKIV